MKTMSKSILITGCSAGGIGASLALSLSQRKENHHIFATVRNTSKIPKELHNRPNVTILALDVASSSSVTEAAKLVRASGHGLDVLINNAGLPFSMPLLDVNLEDAQKVYDVNLWGVVRMIQAFADMIIERKGRIVNVGSIGGMVHLPWNCIPS
jgi:NAD(P)-dependent dehydrogenase (short-subunit alcohol dehydrogenase family)